MKRFFTAITVTIISMTSSAAHIITKYEHPDVVQVRDFAVCYGIARYYSPNIYTHKWSEGDWYKTCSYMLSLLDGENLESVIQIVAPSINISDEPIAGKVIEGHGAMASAVVHYGSGNIDIPAIARLMYPSFAKYKPYHSDHVKWNDRGQRPFPEPFTYYSYKLPSGRFCNVIHCDATEHFDEKGTRHLLDDAKKFWKSHKDPSIDSKTRSKIISLVKDKAVRMADIIVRWNIIRHFYPYYEEDEMDWDNQLTKYLLSASEFNENDKHSLYKWIMLIREFMNPVKDGHLIVQNGFKVTDVIGGYIPEYYSDCSTLYVNDTLLASCPQIGEGKIVILDSIGHKASKDYFVAAARRVNASTEKRNDWTASYGLITSDTAASTIISWHDSAGNLKMDSIAIKNTNKPTIILGKRRPVEGNLGGGMLYIDATAKNFSPKTVIKANENGFDKILIDLRGYPSYDFEKVVEHLIEEDKPYLSLSIPVSSFPFRNNIVYEESNDLIKAKKPRIQGKIAFLCDETTISWGETVLMLVKEYNLGTIIGSNTAGTNGDVTNFDLTFFPFMMTGLRVSNLDGTMHHGIGVKPDIYVCNYAKDIMDGRDRVFEMAIEFLKNAEGNS